MEDNIQEQTNEIENGEGSSNQVYIDALNELKANSVSKDKYDQLIKERDGLVEALKTGQQITVVNEEQEVDIDSLRHELYGDPDKSWRPTEYIEKTLKLREAVMENGGRDPFLPNGLDYQESIDDKKVAEMTAQIYQECLDYAQGDDQLFINELMRRTKDDSPIQRQIGRKR